HFPYTTLFRSPRHPAGGHEGAGQHEKRDGHQGEVLGGLVELERERGQRVVAEGHDGQQRGQAQGHGHGHAHEHEDKQQNEQRGGGHAASPLESSSPSSFMASATSSPSSEAWPPRSRFHRTSPRRQISSA